MAPPIPVFSQAEIKLKYPEIFSDSDSEIGEPGPRPGPGCQLYELIQNQCTFNGNELICLPFKRVFARCPIEIISSNKKKVRSMTRYQNIEITNYDTNNYEQLNEEYKKYHKDGEDILKKFLEADKILRQAYNSENTNEPND